MKRNSLYEKLILKVGSSSDGFASIRLGKLSLIEHAPNCIEKSSILLFSYTILTLLYSNMTT